MRPFDRGLLIFYILSLTLFFIFIVPLLAGWMSAELLSTIENLFSQPEILFVLLGLFILTGIRLLWVTIRPVHKQAVVQEGPLGEVRIALAAIESLVDKVVSQNSGVREVKSRVVTYPSGIGIHVRASVTPDTNVPEISNMIQEQVKERVLEVTGTNIHRVNILIESISAYKPRVE